MAQQAIDRVFRQHHAGELRARRDRHVQVQHRFAALGGQRLAVHRLAQVLGQLVAVARVAGFQPVSGQPVGAGRHAGRGLRGAQAALAVDPAHRAQLGVLGHHGFGARGELQGRHLAVGQLARQPHQLLLALQQAQTQALLAVFHVTLDRFLLAPGFLQPQVPERGHDGRQEQQHGRQRRQLGDRVLPLEQALPPGRRRTGIEQGGGVF